MEDIGVIDEIESGRSNDFRICGVTLLQKTEGWLGIRKYYDNSKFLNRFKYDQIGVYHTQKFNDYKIGDKVKVVFGDKKIVSVDVVGHLTRKEFILKFILNDPILILYAVAIFVAIFIIVLIGFFDIHLYKEVI